MFALTMEVSAVLGEILRKCILLGLILCLRGTPMRAADGPSEGLVTVAVHNDAGVPMGTLIQAEHTAQEIFKQAGVNVEWVNCGTAAASTQVISSCRTTQFPTHLQLRIVRRSQNLTDSVFGVSFLGEDGSGCYSDVFLDPATELHEELHVSLATLLGHVAAHEIAHLLLGTNSHSPTGIMRAHWHREDLANADKGGLLFTTAQGQTMREKVAASLCQRESASTLAAAARN
jgi:hypothetical protein